MDDYGTADYMPGADLPVQEARDKAQQLDEREIWRTVLQTYEGRAVLYDLILQSGVEEPTFDPDPYSHAYRAGVRAVGLYVQKDRVLTIAPETYTMMRKEFEDRLLKYRGQAITEMGMDDE